MCRILEGALGSSRRDSEGCALTSTGCAQTLCLHGERRRISYLIPGAVGQHNFERFVANSSRTACDSVSAARRGCFDNLAAHADCAVNPSTIHSAANGSPPHELRSQGGARLRRRNLALPRAAVVARLGPLVEDLIDQAERFRFVGLEELVAVHRFFDLLELLAGIFGVELVQALA